MGYLRLTIGQHSNPHMHTNTIMLNHAQAKCQKWEVRIKHEGKMRYVGVFADEEVAAAGKCLLLHLRDPGDIACTPMLMHLSCTLAYKSM